MFHVEIPWLLSVFFTIDGVCRAEKERQLGIAYHNVSLWLYLFAARMEHSRDDKWYAKSHCWYMPWMYETVLQEVLTPDLRCCTWHESTTERRAWRKTVTADQSRERTLTDFEARQQAEKANSVVLTYTYRLKSGEVQTTETTAHASRRTIRMRGWPIFRGQQVNTEFWVSFVDAIGEGRSSWKGGVTGCGGTIKPGQTLVQAVREMEATRKFER